MSLERVLEPEVMDTQDEARDYDDMDHAVVNQSFVDDLLAAGSVAGDILDLGTGTAQIPVRLCEQVADCRVLAVDMAVHMLELANYNVEAAGLIERITLAQVDAKGLRYEDQMFDIVMSNSIIHHIPEPIHCLREAVRVTRAGGRLFFRDLMRPIDQETLDGLVETHAKDDNDHQRKMFRESLHAALTVEEMQALVRELGFPADGVSATSDRHWTWSAIKPG
jgi:ubiquinone/menaquinone biosynthesis C-methylase UbiE